MSDNVVDINEHRQCNHEEVCPHCEWRENTVKNFISRIKKMKTSSPEFNEEVKILIDFVEMATRRNVLAEIAGGLIQEIEYLDGDFEEDEE